MKISAHRSLISTRPFIISLPFHSYLVNPRGENPSLKKGLWAQAARPVQEFPAAGSKVRMCVEFTTLHCSPRRQSVNTHSPSALGRGPLPSLSSASLLGTNGAYQVCKAHTAWAQGEWDRHYRSPNLLWRKAGSGALLQAIAKLPLDSPHFSYGGRGK